MPRLCRYSRQTSTSFGLSAKSSTPLMSRNETTPTFQQRRYKGPSGLAVGISATASTDGVGGI